MFHRLHHRAGHYVLLILVSAGLFLPNLGAPSLWDIDEGHNAEAAREMLESGNWIVPTFNFQLRVDKPALLYWLQIGAYQLFGVSEFAARLPSALAALLTVLGTYELGRRLFGASVGLLAGLVLASTILFCAAAHFANPDALLSAGTLLTLVVFWIGYSNGGRGWFVLAGVAAGLAVLAKGPVGFVLPAAVVGLFLLCTRRLRILWDRGLVWGLLAFGLVALPWYIWVAAETKADFLRGFLLTHNVGRFLQPMENHRGPIFYYLVVLLAGFAPWSSFLGLTIWSSIREWRESRVGASAEHMLRSHAHVFLWCWIAVYLVFFSAAGTKLPNYILPLYPAVALLTARLLNRWWTGELHVPRWALHVSVGCLAFVGLAVGFGLALAGGALELSLMQGRKLPGLDSWAVLGMLPVLGACAGWVCLRREQRQGMVAVVAVTAVLFVGALAGWAGVALDAHKAPRPLAEALHSHQVEPEIRVGCWAYYQPSLVFYCRREVHRFEREEQALEFLRCKVPVYLFVPAEVWDTLERKTAQSHRVLGRQRDLYRGCEVVVVTNR